MFEKYIKKKKNNSNNNNENERETSKELLKEHIETNEEGECSITDINNDSINTLSLYGNIEEKEASDAIYWPNCWNKIQKSSFVNDYPWIFFKEQKLGCSLCLELSKKNISNLILDKISPEWIEAKITYSGDNRKSQLSSLRKKIHKHKVSDMHVYAFKYSTSIIKNTIEEISAKAILKEVETTERIFRTVYKIVMENQSYNNFESEIDLQELNGVDMGFILHSRTSANNIANHIGNEMRKKVTEMIIKYKNKISIMIDESTTVAKKSTLIIYLRTHLSNLGILNPINIFLDLVELDDLTSEGIYGALDKTLEYYGFTKKYLSENLISITCDGAAVLMGKNNGVTKRLLREFPRIIVWHCANHRLELSVHDIIKGNLGINKFKQFIDRLYALYKMSPKNARELKDIASDLDMQILKIGKILSTRWVASSFRTVIAVWNNFLPLCRHFKLSKVNKKKTIAEIKFYNELDVHMNSPEFILDLGLMCDALQELSELSLSLQNRNYNVYYADLKIKTTIRVFDERITDPGKYYVIAKKSIEKGNFKGVDLVLNDNNKNLAIDPKEFYSELIKSMKLRLLDKSNEKFTNAVKVVNEIINAQPNSISILHGEEELSYLANKFNLDERVLIQGFRDYKISGIDSNILGKLNNILNSISISSSECERGFSQMNLISTAVRNSLLVENISTLLFIKIVGPPLTLFCPKDYVKSWLLSGRNSAIRNNSKKRDRSYDKYDPDMISLWNYLKK